MQLRPPPPLNPADKHSTTYCNMSSEPQTVALGAGALSLSRLGVLRDAAERLRAALRTAFLERGPRLEMVVYRELSGFLKQYASVSLGADAAVDAAVTAGPTSLESLFVVELYLQDILAACLYLMNEEELDDASFALSHLSLSSRDGADDAANSSQFYVSKAQRVHCAAAFFSLCWLAPIPLHAVIAALHPLLDSGASPPPEDQTVAATPTPAAAGSRSDVAPGLLRHFPAKRRVVSAALSGLVLQHDVGVRGLVRALLLDDSVTTDAFVEAAELVVSLVTGPGIGTAWLVVAAPEGGDTVRAPVVELRRRDLRREDQSTGLELRRCSVAEESRVCLLATQHVSLFEEHAATTAGPAPTGRKPLFLTRIHAASARLPPQSLEDRLNIYCTMWLNRCVRLPLRAEEPRAFAAAYKRLFATNKYFLSPAFAALSLRAAPSVSPDPESMPTPESPGGNCMQVERASAAVARLRILARGTALGAGRHAMLRVLEATMPGLLSLTHCAEMNPSAQQLATDVAAVWRLVFDAESCHAEVAQMAVGSCLPGHSATRGQFTVSGNCIEGARIEYGPTSELGSASDSRWLALSALLAVPVDEPAAGGSLYLPCAPPPLRHALLKVMVAECAQLLAGAESTVQTGTDARPTAPPDLRGQRRIGVLLDGAEGGGSPGAAAPESPVTTALLREVETAVLSWPAESLFGPNASLAGVLQLINSTLLLSSGCLQWGLGLIPLVVEAHQHGPTDRGETARALHALSVASKTIEALPVGDGGEWATLRATALQTIAAAEVKLQHTQTEASAEVNGPGSAAHDAEVNDCSKALTSLAASVAAGLDSQSSAVTSIALMDLSAYIEEVSWTVRQPLSASLYVAVGAVMHVALQALRDLDEACAAGHAVRCLTWIGMYRLDSPLCAVIAALITEELLRPISPVARPGPATIRPAGAEERAARAARLKVRLLDVLLSWCDYDTDGRTLRLVDDYCKRCDAIGSLYRALVALCQPSEPAIVQVAAVHLIGNYVVCVFPRVSLEQVCQLCQEVFRHTRLEMSKAACAAMLAHVAAFVATDEVAVVTSGVSLSQVKLLATVMTLYSAPAGSTSLGTDAPASTHAAVIRAHGTHILGHIVRSHLPGRTALVEEV